MRAKFRQMGVDELRSSLHGAVQEARQLRSVLEGVRLPEARASDLQGRTDEPGRFSRTKGRPGQGRDPVLGPPGARTARSKRQSSPAQRMEG
jgi:hypothetical protein